MRKLLYINIVAALLVLTSCNYFEETPSQYLTPEYLFKDSRWAEQNLFSAFAYLPSGFSRYGGAFLDAATDDAAYAVDNSSINFISRAKLSISNPGEGCWSSSYNGIRRTLFFEKYIPILKIIPSFTYAQVETRKKEWVAEGKTLRAFYYFELIKRYGGVPLVKEVITEKEARKYLRSSFADCVEYVVQLCDEAEPDLPYSNLFGRVSKGVALAVKAKMLAYAASELYNNTDDPTLGYTDGNIMDRQIRAAKALGDVITLSNNKIGVYKLINDFSKIALDITIANNEVIFANPYNNNNGLEKNLYPPTLQGNGSTFPSQELVDSFEYAGEKDPDNPYLNKDPRFYMTVVYDGAVMGPRGEIFTRVGDGATIDALGAVKNFSTITGYYLQKFLSTSINFQLSTPGNTTRMFPIIRFADILLLYAEMANNAYGPASDPDHIGLTALDAINSVRQRPSVNMPVIPNNVTQKELNEKIKNERRVELAFEEQRYFDLRRWKDAQLILIKPVTGTKVTSSGGVLTYSKIIVDDKRDFDPKMYFAPIPYAEIKANSNLKQNPGWN